MFTQHSADKFDLHLSAVENMLNLFPDADDQQMRSFVGKFQIQGDEAVKPMLMLSGGQKSRIAFASLAYQRPHVIIMVRHFFVDSLIDIRTFLFSHITLYLPLKRMNLQTILIWNPLMRL